MATDCDRYLQDRIGLLEQQLAEVNRMALVNNLPGAVLMWGLGIPALGKTTQNSNL